MLAEYFYCLNVIMVPYSMLPHCVPGPVTADSVRSREDWRGILLVSNEDCRGNGPFL